MVSRRRSVSKTIKHGRVPQRFFISHAHGEPDDETLGTELTDALTRAGHAVFIDTSISLGTNWGTEIMKRIEWCDFLIVLLSANSIHSEMVLEEVRLARERRKAHESRGESARPHFLPLRIKYEAPLGYALGAYLNQYEWRTWHNKTDSERIVNEILDVAEGRAETAKSDAPFVTPKPSHAAESDFRRPDPQIDLRSLARPGGASRPDDPFYIQRDADIEVMNAALRVEETIVIKAARQMGKSSLLKRYLFDCQRANKRTALIDLSLFSDQDLAEYPTFLTNIAIDLLDKLCLDIDPKPCITSQPEMVRFVQNKVLKVLPDHLVIAFDEVDRVLGRPYQLDFFSMLRYWHERRSDVPANGWARLELALVISTEPYLLIEDAYRSPFNIREPIDLGPFSEQECRELNRRYNGCLCDTQVKRLFELLCGHAYLTRLAYYRLTGARPMDFEKLVRDAHKDDGPFGDHLRAMLAKLQRIQTPDLTSALRQAITYGTVSKDDAYYRLHGAGLLRKVDGRIVPANQLYARFFGELV